MSTYDEELSLLYRPGMNYICRLVECTIFFISTLLVGLVSYTIVRKSTPAMGQYKYMLLNQILWNFFFDTLLILWQPIPIFNSNGFGYGFILAYSNGIFRYSDREFIFVLFGLLCFIIIGMTHSLYFNMIYRISAIFHDTWIGNAIHEPKWTWRFFLSSLVFAILFIEG